MGLFFKITRGETCHRGSYTPLWTVEIYIINSSLSIKEDIIQGLYQKQKDLSALDQACSQPLERGGRPM